MTTLYTICDNCGEKYNTELLSSEIISNQIETFCPKCGFANEDDFYDEEESNI